ncbi:MAG: phage baseplate assembly protein V [candidate division Zixibacteria bacterium]|jgi:uncharacterized protein involved in type VI secretion and phage assembly|nr:phage baseplate assembly protein V [candidate division Zixibacteria bacterium]
MPVNDATPRVPVTVEMVVAGTKMTVEIVSIELKQHIDRHHDLEVRALLGGSENNNDFRDVSSFTKLLGEDLSISLTPYGGGVDEAQKLEFVGVIVNVESINGIDGLNQIVFHAASPTISLEGARRLRIYENMKPSEIAAGVLRNYRISVGKTDTFGSNIEYLLQHNETDFEFVKRMASANGAFSFYDGSEFRLVTKPVSSPAIELTWRKDLGWFSLGLGTQPMAYAAGTYDYRQVKTLSADSDKPASALSGELARSPKASERVYNKSDKSFLLGLTHAADQSTLTAGVKSATNRAVGRMAKCSGGSEIPSLKVGHCVKVAKMGIFDGVYMIESVHHVVEEGGYSNTFTCIPVDMAYPTLIDHRASVDSLYLGKVTDVEDPDKLGRVKVAFEWQGQGMETVWARPAFPHAGPEWGWVTLPEIDDEVIVGFDRGNPEHPIILGSLYNGKAVPPSEAVQKPTEVKLLYTKGGNKILLSDKSGAEQILLTTKDGQNTVLLTMDGPGITVESKGDISIKGKAITLEADKNIEIKAGGDFKVQAQMNMETKAGMNYQAEGAMVKIKGNLINLN